MADSSPTSRVVLLLVGVATTLVHVALAPGQRAWWPVAIDGALALAVLVALYFVARRPSSTAIPGSALLLLVLAALPFGTHAASGLFSASDALEVLLAYALRNLCLGSALMPQPPIARRLAALGSCFLALFAFMTAFTPTTSALVMVYGVLGMWWLMGTAWERIACRFPSRSSHEYPRFAMASAVAVVAVLAGVAILCIGRDGATTALAGFMPSSGGRGDASPNARSGVNDGDQLVGGQDDASSFGAVETELFLESEMPSLYDMFSDTYQQSAKKPDKKQSRAISLPGDTQQREHRHRARHEQATREFSAVRQPAPAQKKPQQDLRSHALAFVAGPTPLHLRLEIFNRWDGSTLAFVPEGHAGARLLVRSEKGKPWLFWGGHHPRSIFPDVSQHELKIINLKTRCVPSPPNLECVHLFGLSEPSVFGWEENGMLRFDAESIPQLTLLHVRSARTNDRLLAGAPLAIAQSPAHRSSLRELAQQWIEGVPAGWPQVQAVCRRLREDYALDATAVVPAECEDAVEHFLLDAKRGPDYLFATSASVLLYELGYRTRIVSGLYADPANYDRASGCTAIYRDDVHFWAEVMLADGNWVTVEPTPGYEVLTTSPTLAESFQAACLWIWALVKQHWLSLLAVAIATALLVFTRQFWLLAAALLIWWPAIALSPPRARVRWTIWLLEWQAWLAGERRPAGVSLERWLEDHLRHLELDTRKHFVRLAQWAVYASNENPPVPSGDVVSLCKAAALRLRARSIPSAVATVPH